MNQTDLPAGVRGIGLIGLGTMGGEMARTLLAARASESIWVHSRRRVSATAAEEAGALWAQSPAEIAGHCSLVLTVLPDLPQLEEVLHGPRGLLAGLGEDLVVVICSTCSPGGVRDLQTRLDAETGGRVRLVDAPVSGGREGARAGTLSVFAGGAEADVARAAEVLNACGQVAHLGPLGAGQAAKACNQLIVAATTAALAESAVLAERSGLDLRALLDLLAPGYAGSRLLEVKGPKLVAHDHSPDSPAGLMIKDLQFVLQECAATGTPAGHANYLHQLYQQVVDAGLGDLDSTVLQRYLAEANGGPGSKTSNTANGEADPGARG